MCYVVNFFNNHKNLQIVAVDLSKPVFYPHTAIRIFPVNGVLRAYLQTGSTLKAILMRHHDDDRIVLISLIDVAWTNIGARLMAALSAAFRIYGKMRCPRVRLIFGSIQFIFNR